MDEQDWNLASAMPIIGPALNFVSAAQASRASGKSQDKALRWSEVMSNTAWQRGVADMRAAGINPLMAVSKGGASTPGAAVAQGFDARAGDAFSSAVQARTQAKLSESQSDLNEAAAGNQRADTALKAYDMNVRKSTEHLQQQQLATEAHRTEEAKWNASSARWLYESSKAQGKFDEKLEEYGPGTRFLLEILRGVRPAPGRR